MKSYWKKVKYKNGTLYDLVKESAMKVPDHIAYEFMGKKVSYTDFLKQIDDASAALSQLGVKEDEIICIAMPNVPQALITFYAANRIGAVVNMLHPLSSPQEFKFFVNKVNAKTIFVLDQFYPAVKAIRDQTGLLNVIVATKRKLPYHLRFNFSLLLYDKR